MKTNQIPKERVIAELKHVDPVAVLAALEWNEKRTPEALPLALLGIVLRYASEDAVDGVRATYGEDITKIPDALNLGTELGIDSLNVMEILFTVEGGLGIHVEAKDVAGCATFGQLKAVVSQRMAEQAECEEKIIGQTLGVPPELVDERLDQMDKGPDPDKTI